jgi:hypothetical protein
LQKKEKEKVSSLPRPSGTQREQQQEYLKGNHKGAGRPHGGDEMEHFGDVVQVDVQPQRVGRRLNLVFGLQSSTRGSGCEQNKKTRLRWS